MDNGVQKCVEISIIGNLRYRQIIVVGGAEDRMYYNKFKHGWSGYAENEQMVFGI